MSSEVTVAKVAPARHRHELAVTGRDISGATQRHSRGGQAPRDVGHHLPLVLEHIARSYSWRRYYTF
jgi:hypothetical protein